MKNVNMLENKFWEKHTNFRFTNIERKIIVWIIKNIEHGNSLTLERSYSDLCQEADINIADVNNFDTVKESLIEIHNTTMWVSIYDEYVAGIEWISKIRFYEEKVQLRIDDDIFRLILDMKKNYSQRELEAFAQMKCVYTLRVYNLLRENMDDSKETNILQFNLKEFGHEVQSAYDDMSGTRRRILNPAVSEINEFSPYHIICDFEKEGRVFVKINFIITKK